MPGLKALILIFLAVQVTNLHAWSSARERTLARYKTQCDDEGKGKACYDYARSMWNRNHGSDRRISKKYMLRGCDLKYHLACETSREHSVTLSHSRRPKFNPETGNSGTCFSETQLQQAQFSPHSISPSVVQGQKIVQIREHSFWQQVGLVENDVIIRVNNMPFNTLAESKLALVSTGKKFAFEVLRGGQSITLWYSCQ